MLNNENESIDRIGKLLNEQWLIKRSLTDKITNKNIDEIYNAGIESGALGSRLTGGGFGGFTVSLMKEKNHEEWYNKMKKYYSEEKIFEV